MQSAIKVSNLSKIYRLYGSPRDRLVETLNPLRKKYHQEFKALDDINFEIRKGETVGILGVNGSGKSTLLKIISGVLSPTSGQVAVNGRVSALLELGAGFNPEYTGIENIYFQGALSGLSEEQVTSRIPEIADFAEIGEFINQPVRTYSSGMFARLAFAVAINVNPDILIVDEALSVGDSMFQHKCIARMRELMTTGVTVLFVSHSIESVRALCGTAIWLEQGRVKMLGSAKEVANLYMNEIYINNNETVLSTLKEDQREYSGKLSRINNPQVISVLSVDIFNSVGMRTNRIVQGEEFSIRVKIKSHVDFSSLSVGMVVKDRFGIEMTGESYFNKFRKGVACKQDQEMSVQFKSKSILRGGESYGIGIRINNVSRWDRSDNVLIYCDELAASLEVVYDSENPMWFKFQQEFEVLVE